MKRNILITGGARGIGAAMAAEFLRKGADVFAPPRQELDLADPVSVEAFVKREEGRGIDIVINNAGINILNPVEQIVPADWQAMFQVNVTSALRLTQAFLPGMKARQWGRILNISSVFSHVTREKRAAYAMTKAALNAFTRSLTVEYARYGILANSLCPGYVETALTRQNNSPADIEAINAAVPIRRLAQPDEIARVAAFLCSEENTYLTGQDIVVDGGFLCQ